MDTQTLRKEDIKENYDDCNELIINYMFILYVIIDMVNCILVINIIICII